MINDINPYKYLGVEIVQKVDIEKYTTRIIKHIKEAIIQLNNDMFYNTGITTYIWILSKNKRKERMKNSLFLILRFLLKYLWGKKVIG